MSRTDNTRPYRVQIADPYNKKYEKGNGWHWKPMCSRKCWCCTNKCFKYEKRRDRVNWRKERQELMATWRLVCWDYPVKFYDHWEEDDLAECENHEGLRFIDFYGDYSIG